MGKVIAEITMSLDGFIAGPGISSKDPKGTNGQRLQEWIFNKATETDKAMIAKIMNSTGAVITGAILILQLLMMHGQGPLPLMLLPM